MTGECLNFLNGDISKFSRDNANHGFKIPRKTFEDYIQVFAMQKLVANALIDPIRV